MKIGILTMSRAYNYGALLQAYALKKKIRELGHEVYMINYASEMQLKRYNGVFEHSFSLRTCLKNLMRFLFYSKMKKGVDRYNDFINKELDGKNDILKTKEEVEKFVKNYDALIVGSDQMWNIMLPDVNDIYFLNFNFKGKKLTYAISMGDKVSFGNKEKFYLELISKFDNITVREKIANTYLKEKDVTSKVVVDPTLLLKREEWETFSKKETMFPKEGYIFYYSVKTNPAVYELAKKASKILGIPVVNSMLALKTEMHTDFKRCFEMGPHGFVDCVKGASCIITDSFHGTVFSLIFNKPFISVFDNEEDCQKSARRVGLLKSVQEEKRAVTSKIKKSDLEILLKTSPSEKVGELIEEMSKESFKYLDFMIKSKRG